MTGQLDEARDILLPVFSLRRMWTELPQTMCVQDPQQLQRREEETAVQRVSVGHRHVRRPSTVHRVHPDAAGRGGFDAVTRSDEAGSRRASGQTCV